VYKWYHFSLDRNPVLRTSNVSVENLLTTPGTPGFRGS